MFSKILKVILLVEVHLKISRNNVEKEESFNGKEKPSQPLQRDHDRSSDDDDTASLKL